MNEWEMPKPWDRWQPDGPDQRSTLLEIARHMKRAWQSRDKLGSIGFKAGHQLAHKGWKFGSAVVDLADGSGVPGIKGLRALIVAGRHDWFEEAARRAPGEPVTSQMAPSPLETQYLGKLVGIATPLSRIELPDAAIWMVAEPAGWRVAAVFVSDADRSGIKAALQLAPATGGGCLTLVAALYALAALGLVRSMPRRRRR